MKNFFKLFLSLLVILVFGSNLSFANNSENDTADEFYKNYGYIEYTSNQDNTSVTFNSLIPNQGDKTFASKFQYLNDKRYFYVGGEANAYQNKFYYLDENNNVNKLAIKNRKNIDDFLISNDEKNIIKTSSHSININGQYLTIASINLVEISTNKQKFLFHKVYKNQEKVIDLLTISQDNKWLYFSEQNTGLGGYILFQTYPNLTKINLETKEKIQIFGTNGIIKDYDSISSISKDGNLVSYFKGAKLFVYNVKDNKSTSFDIPYSEDYSCAGTAMFSEDNKSLAYNMANCSTEKEYVSIIVVDLEKNTQKNIYSAENGWVDGWLNDKVLFHITNDDQYTINKDGTGKTEITDLL